MKARLDARVRVLNLAARRRVVVALPRHVLRGVYLFLRALVFGLLAVMFGGKCECLMLLRLLI